MMRKFDILPCDECGIGMETEFRTGKDYTSHSVFAQIRNGMTLNLFGGYGMFTDVFNGGGYVYLCHDCVLDVFHVLPNSLRDRFGNGMHPYDGERCCEYGWE